MKAQLHTLTYTWEEHKKVDELVVSLHDKGLDYTMLSNDYEITVVWCEIVVDSAQISL